MVSGNDPVESFFNSLNSLESGIRRAAKDFQSSWCWPLHAAVPPRLHGDLFFPPQFNDVVVVLGSVMKKKKKQSNNNHALTVDGDDELKKKAKSSFIRVSSSSSTRENVNVKHNYLLLDKQNDGTCVNCCLQFALVTCSLFFQGFLQPFPNPFKTHPIRGFDSIKQPNKRCEFVDASPPPSFNGFFTFELIQNLHQGILQTLHNTVLSSPQFHHLGLFNRILKGRQADVAFFLANLNFARVGGAPPSLVGVSSLKDQGEDNVPLSNNEESEATTSSAHKIANGLLNIPLSNVERLRSTLSAVSLTELIELVPQLGRPSNDYPDKKKLFSVQDFFRYTESEGRRFFEELDRDGDGQVTLEDLEIAMRRRRLPRRYAREFMRRTRSYLFSKSFGWKQFLTLMEQKEPTILRAYTTLCLSKSGTLQKSQILTSLKNAGLPANGDNAVAMMRFLNADSEGSISYGHFRNFMLLLPSDRLEDDPRSIWFEAATVVAVPPPVEIPAGSVLKSALAGGLASALSTSLLHPVDTIKTRLQASTLSFPELVSKLPQIGVQGLYRGSIPAVLGQFSSHGLRTGIFEASKLVLINVAPTLPEFQVQSISSFCSTVLGTAVRIPCEVLKQRLQAGIFDNVGEAIVGTLRQDGLRGFFRGTGATLCREVPFYVAGMGLYAESKKAVQHLLSRELEPWETIAVGALSGGLAAVVTTPFDVMKTRMMTAPQGLPVSMSMVAFSILRQEGPLGLFKGAIPRFFWIAPLGAMNFAGYELARKAMDKTEESTSD